MTLISQVRQHTEIIASYAVYIGVVSEKETDVNHVREQMSDKLKNSNVKFFSVQGAVQNRLEWPDVQRRYFKEHKLYLRRRATFNVAASILLWYCSQNSRYTLISDSSLRAKDKFFTFLNPILQQIDEEPLRLCVHLTEKEFQGSIYTSKNVGRFARSLFYLSPYMTLKGFIFHFNYGTPSLKKSSLGIELFNSITPVNTHENPPAKVSTSMDIVRNYSLAQLYNNAGSFWAVEAKAGDYILIKFNQPINIKRVLIETGLDIDMTDIITSAVLEESFTYKNGNCVKFEVLSDFRAGNVDLSLHRKRYTSTCLRIRLLQNTKTWNALHLIKVLTH